jgi:rubrerythrin
MKLQFSPMEIIDIAISVEKNGEIFYRKAAELVDDRDDVKQTLTKLADWEAEHHSYFLKYKKGSDTSLSPLFDESDKNRKPLTELMGETHRFKNIDAVLSNLKKCKSTDEILELALTQEINGIGFYNSIIEVLADDSAKKEVREIVKEEEAHVSFIEHYLKIIKEG